MIRFLTTPALRACARVFFWSNYAVIVIGAVLVIIQLLE